jgi:hypothetical protein
MSLLWALRKFIDSVAHRQEEEALRRQREDWPPDVEPDSVEEVPSPRDKAPVLYRCRICNFESTRGDYCPTCLASTMEPCKRR